MKEAGLASILVLRMRIITPFGFFLLPWCLLGLKKSEFLSISSRSTQFSVFFCNIYCDLTSRNYCAPVTLGQGVICKLDLTLNS